MIANANGVAAAKRGRGHLATAFRLHHRDEHPAVAVHRDLLAKEALSGFEVSERFYEIGTLAGLEETRNYFKENSL